MVNALRMKIKLDDWRPPIWRRFTIPVDYSFLDLHKTIQILADWGGYHLFQFDFKNGLHIRTPYEKLPDESPGVDPQTILLRQLAPGDCFDYTYDFGDYWVHKVKVEKPLETAPNYPQCLQGQRAFPPEDCGGLQGYAQLLETLKSGKKTEPIEACERFNGFDPEKCDVEEINAQLKLLFAGINPVKK